MAINFPTAPTLNQTYTFNGRTWTWNGVGWQATGSTGLTVYTKTDFTATAGQTSFSCTYTVGFVDVYYNGSKLSTSEYTATTGSTVVLGTAAALGDIIETIAWTISSSFNPSLGSASATSLAIGGATIGSNALAVTGTTQLNSALIYGGITLSNAVTGTGNMVLSTSPSLTTPLLGTPTSGNLVNCTGYSLTPITNSLGANVVLNNSANYFDGPSVAQGSSGTWFASGTVVVGGSGGANSQYYVKLWDGTTVIASAFIIVATAGQALPVSLSGYLASPAGNLRMSARPASSGDGNMYYNLTGNSKDCTVSAIRVA